MNTSRLSLAVESTARLVREIRSQTATVSNSAATRKAHPTYGITKGRLTNEHAKLIGMIEAWLYVTEVWEHAGKILWTEDTYQTVYVALGVNLHEIDTQVRSA